MEWVVVKLEFMGAGIKGLLTPLAQRVVAEIQDNFPTVIRCPTVNNTICALSAQAELAYALSEEPTHHLLDTYRQKQLPYNLRITNPSDLGCSTTKCPLSCLPTLFDDKKCPEASCTIRLNDVLYGSEQKLVDTMLTCDMIHATGQNIDLIVVISDDDDLLPAIRTAVLRGGLCCKNSFSGIIHFSLSFYNHSNR